MQVGISSQCISFGGGGENWGEVHANVNDADVLIRDNENGDGAFKHHAVGGAAAAVSPVGWK